MSIGSAWQKASKSYSNSNCVEARWAASSPCQSGECAEVRRHQGRVQVRDSKLGDASPVLSLEPDAWRAFLAEIKAGRLDLRR
jgi:hypothetical protein